MNTRFLFPVGVYSPDGKVVAERVDSFEPNIVFYRIMRRTGKLYFLTLVSAALGIFSSVFVALWYFNTSKFHLWFDLVPSGFGMASLINSVLVVSLCCLLAISLSHLRYDYRR